MAEYVFTIVRPEIGDPDHSKTYLTGDCLPCLMETAAHLPERFMVTKVTEDKINITRRHDIRAFLLRRGDYCE